MANEIFKELKTRIALKYNTYEYWTTGDGKDYAPLKGEVCFCAIESKEQGAQTAPTVLFKVGVDGQTKFSALKWASALAADVYDWAKVAGVNVFTKDGTGNVVSGIEYDATLNSGKGGFKFTTTSVATAEGFKDLQDTIAAIEKDITDNRDAWVLDTDTRYSFSTDGDKLVVKKTLYTNGVAGTEEAVGTYEFLTATEVAETLKDYYTKLELEGKIHTEEEIKAMEIAHATAAGKVDQAITVKVGGADVVFDGSEAKTADVDSAISAAIAGLGALASKDKIVEGDIEGTISKDKIANFATEVAAVKVSEAGTADKVAHSFTVNGVAFDGSDDKSVTIDAASLGLESAMHFIGALAEAPASAKSGDVYLNTATKKEYVYSEGQGWVELGDEGSHALRTVKIEGEGYLTGGGDLSADRKIDIAAEVKTMIDNGAAAKEAVDAIVNGTTHTVAKSLDDAAVEQVKTIKVNTSVDAEKLGGQLPAYYATKESIDAIPGIIESKITAYDAGKKFGDIITHNAAEFAGIKEDGAKALADENKLAIDAINDTETGILAQAKAYSDSLNHEDTKYTAAADGGLKLNENNEFAIDDTVVFVLDCNW